MALAGTAFCARLPSAQFLETPRLSALPARHNVRRGALPGLTLSPLQAPVRPRVAAPVFRPLTRSPGCAAGDPDGVGGGAPETSEGKGDLAIDLAEVVRRRQADDAAALSEWYEREFAKPADRVWDIHKPEVYYFAVANAQSMLDDGALLEEVLSDAITRAQRGGRPRDVWMIMEPAFLDHPKLASLKGALRKPTAAILSTNGAWMMSIVRELLPQATIGKFHAPTPSLPNPFKSNLEAGGAVIGGGAVWH